MFGMIKRNILPVAALLAVLPFTAGCSGNNSGASSSTSGSGSASSSNPAPTGGGTTYNGQDTAINKAAQSALQADSSLKGVQITVSTSGGQVTMTGSVPTVDIKNSAEKDVMQAIQSYSAQNAGVIDKLMVQQTK